jgi:1-acyl-sn-glycerol-3-phosphate acyltransferase
MLQRIVSAVKGSLACAVLFVSTLTLFSLMMPFALLKLVAPVRFVRAFTDFILNNLAEIWIGINGLWIAAVGNAGWQTSGLDKFNHKGWYLVSSNHQSWVDILVLQRVFNRRIPLLKFFIKHELIYVPIMGLAWWALDFPFMRRKGGASARKDLETARKACEKFRVIPTSVISFMEGTRYTPAKAKETNTPYRHLLKPKTGGIGMALETMGEIFDGLVDVTIVYPQGIPTFVDLLVGRVDDVIVNVRLRPIPKHLLVNDKGEPPPRTALQAWINEMWVEKDEEIDQINARLAAARPSTVPAGAR